MMDVRKKLEAILADKLGVKAETITPESRFVDDLGADSLDIVELVMEFENQFGITIPDKDAESLVTVQDAINYISAALIE